MFVSVYEAEHDGTQSTKYLLYVYIETQYSTFALNIKSINFVKYIFVIYITLFIYILLFVYQN